MCKHKQIYQLFKSCNVKLKIYVRLKWMVLITQEDEEEMEQKSSTISALSKNLQHGV